MLPGDLESKAKTRELSRFHDTRFEPELRKLFEHLTINSRDSKLNEVQASKINMRLTELSNIVDSTPTELTLAHCGYPITFEWLDMLAPLLPLVINWPEKIFKWRQEIEVFSAVSAELSDYRPKLKEWLDSL
jgi:hypothetical protein